MKREKKTRPIHNHVAFTLIELLIVVAIIAILAAIALPNFLEAQTRSKVARVKSDLRTIATALESYATDYNEYPPVPIGLGPRFRHFRPLTTPVAYLTTIPKDPFKSIDPHAMGPLRTGIYAYGAMPLDSASRWCLASDGPDRRLNGDPLSLLFYPGYSEDFFYNQFSIYDATNGTISLGDIFRASDHQM
jgi:prepilin-type N-terminal cleavage/methylation domain-containing protein